MNYKEGIIQLTEYMLESLFRNARATPEKKLNWKPLDTGRSVMDQLQECAQVCYIFKNVLESRQPPHISEDQAKRDIAERSKWTTIDECETKAKESTETLFKAIRDFPDEEVGGGIEFAPGYEVPVVTVMSWHYHNLSYHHGQISYIQTLYGDMDPH